MLSTHENTVNTDWRGRTSGDEGLIREGLFTKPYACLTRPSARWRRALERGIVFARSFSGEPAAQANGRQYEFLRLIWHLDAYEGRHGSA